MAIVDWCTLYTDCWMFAYRICVISRNVTRIIAAKMSRNYV